MHTGPLPLSDRFAALTRANDTSARPDAIAVLSTVAVLGLLGIALIHLLDLPGTIGPAPVQGILYLVLIVACLGTAFLLLHVRAQTRWVVVALLGLSPAIAYLLTRTVGLPFDTGDIGKWGDRLGMASLFVEGLVVFTAVYALWLGRRAVAPGRRRRELDPVGDVSRAGAGMAGDLRPIPR